MRTRRSRCPASNFAICFLMSFALESIQKLGSQRPAWGAAGQDLPGGRTQEGSIPPPHLCKEVVCFQWYTRGQSLQIWHSKEVTCRYANPKGLGLFSGRVRVILSAKNQKGNAELFGVFAALPGPCIDRGCFPPCFQGIGAKRNSYCASRALNYLQVDSTK